MLNFLSKLMHKEARHRREHLERYDHLVWQEQAVYLLLCWQQHRVENILSSERSLLWSHHWWHWLETAQRKQFSEKKKKKKIDIIFSIKKLKEKLKMYPLEKTSQMMWDIHVNLSYHPPLILLVNISRWFPPYILTPSYVRETECRHNVSTSGLTAKWTVGSWCLKCHG